jgi:Lipase (class 3)
MLQELVYIDAATTTATLTTTTDTDRSNTQSSSCLLRSSQELLHVIERSGLMGQRPGTKSVKEELDVIRKWHADHGYKGGLVVRELLQPLFEQHYHDSLTTTPTNTTPTTTTTNNTKSSTIIDDRQQPQQQRSCMTLEDLVHPNLARRECYYMYYEITPNGEIKHDIFCRGTTLTIDIWTSLTTWMKYDEELDCRVHMGFNRQATHILHDILPLMAPPSPRTTVRVSGHSLGGAVAYLLAAKLSLRGYRVTQVTSIEAPRICATKTSAKRLQSLLPPDTLRIENDVDPIPLLPPFAYTVGNKLYLVDSLGKMAYLPANANNNNNINSWTDSVFVNARVWEILSSQGRTHRVKYIISQLRQALYPTKDGT